jgi:CII-binding regulator of phage lambda lysogenization HflD
MSRDHYKTVTNKESFTIVIHALPPQQADGKATFMQGVGSTIDVHAVTLDDLKTASRELNKLDGERFSALVAIRGSLESRDNLALAKAKERLERVQQLDKEYQNLSKKLEKLNRSLDKLIAPFPDVVSQLRRDADIERSPSWLLSSEVSRMVGLKSQIVLWEVRGAFRPAIYCSDLSAALYIHTFFIAPTGGLGFRNCPYDGEQFFQEMPNQEYCCPAHREAHRVARWRNEQKKKRLAGETGKTGRKNGTHKTR